MGFGTTELIVILLIVLVVFGANKLPGLGDALGRSIKNFRRASQGNDELEVNESKQVGDAGTRGQLDQGSSDVEDAEVVAAKKAER